MSLATIAKGKQAFTLIELLVVMAIIAIMVAMSGPVLYRPSGSKPTQIACMSNLRQIGLGFWLYYQDNSNQSPWQVSFDASSVAADCFLKLTPYLKSPKAFVCPADKARQVAPTNFFGFNTTNLSYFVATLSNATNPYAILAGDRHLASNNQPVRPGVLAITDNAAMSWTKELHFTKESKQTLGILLFAAGHVARTPTKELPDVLTKQAIASTRLVVP